MKWKVEVECKPDLIDSIGLGIKGDIKDLGIYKVEKVRTSQIYLIEGDIAETQIEEVGAKLLTDSVTQVFKCRPKGGKEKAKGERRKAEDRIVGAQHAAPNSFVVEVMYKAGVTDAVSDSVKKGIKDLGIEGVKSVTTAQKYRFFGKLNKDEIDLICKRLLANEVIQQWSINKNA